MISKDGRDNKGNHSGFVVLRLCAALLIYTQL